MLSINQYCSKITSDIQMKQDQIEHSTYIWDQLEQDVERSQDRQRQIRFLIKATKELLVHTIHANEETDLHCCMCRYMYVQPHIYYDQITKSSELIEQAEPTYCGVTNCAIKNLRNMIQNYESVLKKEMHDEEEALNKIAIYQAQTQQCENEIVDLKKQLVLINSLNDDCDDFNTVERHVKKVKV